MNSDDPKLWQKRHNSLSVYRILLKRFKTDWGSLVDLTFENTFQNLSVSSPAPVTIHSPSGLVARYKTRYVWPVSFATWVRDGYRQIKIWFCEYPWVETNSFVCLLQAKLQTWEPVSILCRGCWVKVFQNFMHRSAVPPPEAKRPCWWGDHAIASIGVR